MTSSKVPKSEDDQGHVPNSPKAGPNKAGLDLRQWTQKTSAWLSNARQKIGDCLRIAFAFKRDGHDVPIAVAVFIAIVPFYLLWQQNKLAYRQEQILRVQTNANTLTTDRQITIDINHADGARNKLAATITAYKYLDDATVTVSFYKKNSSKSLTRIASATPYP